MLPGSAEAALGPPRNRTDFRLLKLDLAMADDSLAQVADRWGPAADPTAFRPQPRRRR